MYLGRKKGGQSAVSLDVYISRLQKIYFRYNEQERLYYKYNGTSEKNEPHTMTNGVQLTAANVILMYDHLYKETDTPVTTYGFDLKSGGGSLYSGGTGRPIRWTRTADGLKFMEADGNVLSVAPGKTYVVLIRDDYAGNTVIK